MANSRLMARARFRTVLTYVAMGLLLVVAIIIGDDEIKHHINAIDAWVANLGHWGVLAFIVLFVLATSLLVPETVLSIMTGALFGFGRGFLAVLVGSLLAATLQYTLSRRLL